jgi:hypothetical protein
MLKEDIVEINKFKGILKKQVRNIKRDLIIKEWINLNMAININE